MREHFYQGTYGDIGAILQFAASGIWDLATYHTPEPVAAAALGGMVFALLASIWRRRLDALALLIICVVGAAVFAAVVRLYPFGATRQSVYLGPAVFLAAGFSLVQLADELPSIARWAWRNLRVLARRAWDETRRRPWLAASSLILIGAAGCAVFAQLANYEGDTRFGEPRNIDEILVLLEYLARPDDLVYTSRYLSPPAMFYHKENPGNYHYGEEVCEPSLEVGCVPEMLAAFDAADGAGGIWIVHKAWETLPADIDNPIFASERVVTEGDARLIRIANGRMASALLAGGEGADDDLETRMMKRWERIVPAEPAVRSDFDVYYVDAGELALLIYARKPCAAADARGRFLLSVIPEDLADLPRDAQDGGMDHQSLNFNFAEHGAIFGETCVILRHLPEYPIAALAIGQWLPYERGLWSARILLPAHYEAALSALSGAIPAASAGGFDIYADGDSLTYVKRQCAESDTRGRFSLSAYPSDPSDIADDMRSQNLAHNSLNFAFAEHGARFDDKCVIIRELPDYPISRIETGQWLPGKGELWSARISFRN